MRFHSFLPSPNIPPERLNHSPQPPSEVNQQGTLPEAAFKSITSPIEILNFPLPILLASHPHQRLHKNVHPPLHLHLFHSTSVQAHNQPSHINLKHPAMPIQHHHSISKHPYNPHFLSIPSIRFSQARIPIEQRPPSPFVQESLRQSPGLS